VPRLAGVVARTLWRAVSRRIGRKVDVPVDAREGRRALHRLARARRVLDALKLDKANKFAVAIVARPARLVADKAAEVALEDAVGDVGRKLGKEERLGWLCTAHGMKARGVLQECLPDSAFFAILCRRPETENRTRGKKGEIQREETARK